MDETKDSLLSELDELDFKMESPKLTLTPVEDDITEATKAVEHELGRSAAQSVADMAESHLTEEEKKQVSEFAEQIDITNPSMVLQYGVSAQKKMADFSETALSRVKTKDTGEVGSMLSELVNELHGFDAIEESKGGFFGKFKKKSYQLKTRYDSVAVSIDRITNVLAQHQVQLLKDITLLQKMYDINLVHFKELSMYIIAGKKKLEETRQKELAEAIEKAKISDDPIDAQMARDLSDRCHSFEKKLHDLEITRTISLQMAPQIRMIQSNDSQLVEKIQTVINNTIPLWKSQMILAISLENSQKAISAQRAVTDTTNQLLRKNADLLRTGSVETAKESERAIVDLETLKHTNAQLIGTIDDVMKIQQEGRARRKEAEKELAQVEQELKNKLLEVQQQR